MQLKLDLHVHTKCSKDAFTDPVEVPQIVKKRGLDGIAITEHNALSSFGSNGVLVIPGVEISAREGHIIALGAKELVPRDLTASHTIQLLRRQGCVIIAPHPYDRSSPSVDPLRLRLDFDAVETINSGMIPYKLGREKSEKAAEILGLPKVAGSDSHIPSTIGDAYTLIDTPSNSVEDILNSIRRGKTTPCGGPTSIRNKFLKFRISATRPFR